MHRLVDGQHTLLETYFVLLLGCERLFVVADSGSAQQVLVHDDGTLFSDTETGDARP